MRPHAGGAAITMGVALTALYTALIAGADAITKLFGQAYAAPQLFAVSGFIVAALALAANARGPRRRGMRTACPGAMAVRVVATVAGSVAFYHAFRLLPFAEVFLFIALIPLMTALVSGPVLGEEVRSQAWAALMLGLLGVWCLFPGGLSDMGAGHLVALLAVALGTVSMVASRYIGRRDDNLLAQVFYPNLGLAVAMLAALPFVWRPMGLADLGWAAGYATLLFGARWVLVAALRALPAYVVTPLMNLQFVWMVALGALAFGEVPGVMVFAGAAIMVAAGAWLILDQTLETRRATRVVPAE
ncbi:DMT family transporter [Roseovarius sp. SCSIO 43702]|uniref:DMT family transporter n=1 Tax=Roseovarius sp. SCSIO 43702 TaxID=2823043 RepID=UPI001C73A879|nr:DMT family transporter [Roseovarius sp. SCSIO 43702]QYX55246.1 DMT family transporter [Roseovarius sp. SCSIO 43702]